MSTVFNHRSLARIATIICFSALISAAGGGSAGPNLAKHRFYTYSNPPSTTYPDKNAAKWTGGTQLTDGKIGAVDPMAEEWVGLVDPFDIELDLGHEQDIKKISIHALHYEPWDIAYPTATVEIDGTAVDGKIEFSAAKTKAEVKWASLLLEAPQTGRKVKIIFANDKWTFIDEIKVQGYVNHEKKYVPDDGKVLNGIYSPNPGADTGENLLSSGPDFKKKFGAFLWYANFTDNTSFAANAGGADFLNLLKANKQALQIQLMPFKCTYPNNDEDCVPVNVAEDITMGLQDDYLEKFFEGAANWEIPIYLRLAGEMNLHYGKGWDLDPVLFKEMWRRVFNIAKATEADNVAFVFAPARDYGASEFNKQGISYYPGDDYVHWVGMSTYNDVKISTDTVANAIKPIYDAFPNKPFMITEGAANTGRCSNREEPIEDYPSTLNWINSLFVAANTHSRFKAMFWFNENKGDECHFRLQDDQDALNTFNLWTFWHNELLLSEAPALNP